MTGLPEIMTVPVRSMRWRSLERLLRDAKAFGIEISLEHKEPYIPYVRLKGDESIINWLRSHIDVSDLCSMDKSSYDYRR